MGLRSLKSRVSSGIRRLLGVDRELDARLGAFADALLRDVTAVVSAAETRVVHRVEDALAAGEKGIALRVEDALAAGEKGIALRVEDALAAGEKGIALRVEDALAAAAREGRTHSDIVKQTVHLAASRLCGAGPRIRVLFLVHHFEAWDSLGDVHALMLASPDFDPVVATIPRRFPGSAGFGDEEVAHVGLDRAGVAHLRLNMEDSFAALDIVKALAPDVIFRQSQWDADIGPGFATEEIRFARLCYVPYPIMNLVVTRESAGAGIDYDCDTPFHRACWRIFCATSEEAERYAEGCVRGAEQIVATGHPKVARLMRAAAAGPHWPLAGDPVRRIAWSPHHSVGDDWSRFGTFPQTARPMLEWARGAPGSQFVLSPHPALFQRFAMGGLAWTTADLDAFLAEWRSLPNTAVFSGGGYAAMVGACDGVVTDGLSMLIEPQLFGKPIAFIERPGHVSFTKAAEKVLRGVHCVASVAEARAALEASLTGGDSCSAAQAELRDWLLSRGDAAPNLLGSIREGLGRANPAEGAASGGASAGR